MLAQPGRGTLQALAGQLRAPSLLRRQGAAGALRHVCMSAEEDGTLQEVVSDPGVLAALLGPISGAAEGQVRVALNSSFELSFEGGVGAAGRKGQAQCAGCKTVLVGYGRRQDCMAVGARAGAWIRSLLEKEGGK